jgi:hypothetical protein
MNKALPSIPSMILGSLFVAGCGDEIDMSKVDCLSRKQDTREAVTRLCNIPPELATLDTGKLTTPADVQSFNVGKKEGGYSVVKVKIAPGRMVFMVWRAEEGGAYSKFSKRVQIFENGKLLAEKKYTNADMEIGGNISTEDFGKWMDELFGTHRINVREFVSALSNPFTNGLKTAATEVKNGSFLEKSRFSNEQFTSTGDYKLLSSGDKVLHGKGERSWTVFNPRESFRTFYKAPTEANFTMSGAAPYKVEEIWVFEDGFLAKGSRKLHFSTGPNPYVETGIMAYTGRMLSANLENGTVLTPNGIKYTVTNGIVEPRKK